MSKWEETQGMLEGLHTVSYLDWERLGNLQEELKGEVHLGYLAKSASTAT